MNLRKAFSLVKDSPLQFEPGSYGLITGITLPNDGATLSLYGETGTAIHAVRYNLPWNDLDWKTEGGWSLESPDPDLVCKISNYDNSLAFALILFVCREIIGVFHA